jgi:hypothetical protein
LKTISSMAMELSLTARLWRPCLSDVSNAAWCRR